MLSSGLLSLSVHEALTFDGTEIAVHPDLFADSAGSTTTIATTNAATAARSPALTTGSRGVSSSGAASTASPFSQQIGPSPQNQQQQNPSSGPTSPHHLDLTNDPSAVATITSNMSQATTRRLEVGNMIEINVWDPIRGNARPPRTLPSHILSSQRSKRVVASETDPSTTIKQVGIGSTNHSSGINSLASDRKISTTPSLELGGDTTSSISSLSPSAAAATKQAAPTLSPERSWGDRNAHIVLEKPPRPPQRGSFKGGVTTTTNAIPKPKHFRDISDMTMDMDVVGDVFLQSSADTEIVDPMATIESTHNWRLSFVMMIGEKSLTSLKGTSRSQISLLRQVADLYNLSPYDMVTVHKVEKEQEEEVLKRVSADFVMVTIKDQYISRGQLQYFQSSLLGRWIYEGERLFSGKQNIKAHAREIRHANEAALSGIITQNTKITFRSRSARFLWLVQLSSEMWEYASPDKQCDIYFDKFLNFMYKLFGKWKELEATHSLTVIFFSRTQIMEPDLNNTRIKKDVYGRYYEDHYKTVIGNETTADWDSLVVRVKREFNKYPMEMGWKPGKRRPSTAMQGNVLESINVALNLLQFHYLDRDLYRTGNSIVVITPDCGVFEVDRTLATITYQRMMDNGIGSDMLCLGLPPLHVAPFFLYTNDFQAVEAMGVDPNKAYFEIPHWSNPSFLAYDEEHFEDVEKERVPPVLKGRQIQVGPNGFLVPPTMRKPSTTTPPSSPAKTLSAMGNSGSMSTASEQQQRKLISGRNFEDILQACRPRNSAYLLPTPLVNLIRLYEMNNKNKEDRDKQQDENPLLESDKQRVVPYPLREWGTLDFHEISRMAPLVMASRRSLLVGGGSPLLGPEMKSDSSNNSASSSFASQLSDILGRSLDRQSSSFSGKINMAAFSPQNAGKYKIQRPPSLNLLTDPCANEGNTNEASPLTQKRNQSDESLSSMVDMSGRDSLDLGEQSLRDLMKRHDAHYSKPRKLRSARLPADPSSPLLLSESQRKDSPQYANQIFDLDGQGDPVSAFGGGVGAALVQYGISPDRNQNGMGAPALTRTSSGRFSIPPSQIPTPFEGRPMSPHVTRFSRSLLADPSESTKMPHHSALLNMSIMEKPKISVLLRPVRSSSETTANGEVKDDRPVEKKEIRMIKNKNHVLKKPGSPLSVGKSPPRVAPGLKGQPIAARTKLRQQPPPQSENARRRQKRKKIVNPFRQQDEDEELKKKNHNMRRWSHVFPAGVLEFRRRAAPNWKSLCQPAILPLTNDYIPSPQELEDTDKFEITPYTLIIGTESCPYANTKEALEELVRQRVTLDYQIVSQSPLKDNRTRKDIVERIKGGPARKPGFLNERNQSGLPDDGDDSREIIQHVLSMGHRVHFLTYDSLSDSIDVKVYNTKDQDASHNQFDYDYFLYSPSTNSYCPTSQTFTRYPERYNWSSLDHLILKARIRSLDERFRCKRLTFSLIPPLFETENAEQQYLDKFKRLLEYLSNLRDKEVSKDEVDVKVGLRKDPLPPSPRRQTYISTVDTMRRFHVKLRRGKGELYEWSEIAIDSVFDAERSHRIMISWLAASSSKIENQVQLLQRRCAQFGLNLLSVPETSISCDIFLNPLFAPLLHCVRSADSVGKLQDALTDTFGFCDDGIHITKPTFLRCIENPAEFDFASKKPSKNIYAKQFVHRSTGAIFVRLMKDQKGWAVVAFILNYTAIAQNSRKHDETAQVLGKVQNYMDGLSSSGEISSR